MAAAVQVHGLRELNRAFRALSKDLSKELRSELRDVAKPVQQTAQMLAASQIRNVQPGDPWTRMRIGVTQKLVYVAPRKKGGRGRTHRPNFAGLLSDRAMQPALAQHEPQIVRRLERMLDQLGVREGF